MGDQNDRREKVKVNQMTWMNEGDTNTKVQKYKTKKIYGDEKLQNKK